jgi:ubiquitin C-terminal hydrolase
MLIRTSRKRRNKKRTSIKRTSIKRTSRKRTSRKRTKNNSLLINGSFVVGGLLTSGIIYNLLKLHEPKPIKSEGKSDKKPEPNPHNFINDKNNCYIHALFQALFNLEFFKKIINNYKNNTNDNYKNNIYKIYKNSAADDTTFRILVEGGKFIQKDSDELYKQIMEKIKEKIFETTLSYNNKNTENIYTFMIEKSTKTLDKSVDETFNSIIGVLTEEQIRNRPADTEEYISPTINNVNYGDILVFSKVKQDIFDFPLECNIKGIDYKLKSIVYKTGTKNYGHYTAGLLKNNKWYKADDMNKSSELTSYTINTCDETIRMVFYEKSII